METRDEEKAVLSSSLVFRGVMETAGQNLKNEVIIVSK